MHQTYPQEAYSSYPQPTFPPKKYPTYPQGSYLQGTTQEGVPYQSADNHAHFTGFAPPSSDELYKQSPLSNLPAASNVNLNTHFDQSNSRQQYLPNAPDSNSNTYPAFPKFTTEPAARKPGAGDSLNELELRLRDIKNGL